MAELMFKRGLQAALNTLITTNQADDGCFYLTEDTHRLYVGQKDSKTGVTTPVLLNQTVQVVENLADLPDAPPAADHDFYYVRALNILAVYDSKATTESKWVQINPDTDTNDVVTVDDIEFAKTSASSDAVVYTLTLSQKKYDIDGSEVESDLENLTATLTLKTEDIANIVPESAQVGLVTSGATGGGVNINTTGAGSDATTLISLVPGDNIDSITAQDGKITVNAHNNTYTVGVVVNEGNVFLRLTDTVDENTYDVAVNGGKDIVVTGNADTGAITVAHSVYNTANASVENKASLDARDTLHIISGITLDNGHITNIATSDIVMPFDTHLVSGVTHDDNSWKATFADNNENSWTIDFSGDAENMESALKTYIDQGLAAANTALTYKGTIATPTALDSLADVEVGDVYLLSENYSTDTVSYRKGDLFIAISKSGAAGKLEPSDLEWTYVPSGDELIIDTHFKGIASVSGKVGAPADTNNNGSATFHIEAKDTIDGNNNTPEDNETLQLIAGNDLEIVNNTETGSKTKVATVRHADFTTVTPNATTKDDVFEIQTITGITVDNGHVTEIDTTKYNIATYELTGANNKISLGDSTNSECGNVTVSDDNTWINATVANNELKIEHVGPSTATNNVVVTNDTNLTQEGALNVISGVHYDAKGHVTAVDTASLKMPKDTTYESYVGNGTTKLVDNATANNPSLVLKDRDDNTWGTQLASDNEGLTITGSENKVTFNLVWGSF